MFINKFALIILFSFADSVVVVIRSQSTIVWIGNNIFLCKTLIFSSVMASTGCTQKTGWSSSWLRTLYCLSSHQSMICGIQMVPLHTLEPNHLASDSYISFFGHNTSFVVQTLFYYSLELFDKPTSI